MRAFRRVWMMAGLVLVASGFARAQAPAQPVQPAGELPRSVDNILSELQRGGRMLFKLADENNDGLISQKEAVDAGNLIIGGLFFRADQNGDGVLSPDEFKQAREALFRQQPLLRHVIEKGMAEIKASKRGNDSGTDPVKTIGSLLDTNTDKQIQASEVRQAVTSTVQGFFALADTNRDNLLSPMEINAAMVGVARAAAQTAFQQADTDKNGSLSKAEFDKAVEDRANVLFAIVDANSDGQLSPEEAKQAWQVLGSQLKSLMLQEAPNSPRNLIRSGATPDQVAPVPVVTPRR